MLLQDIQTVIDAAITEFFKHQGEEFAIAMACFSYKDIFSGTASIDPLGVLGTAEFKNAMSILIESSEYSALMDDISKRTEQLKLSTIDRQYVRAKTASVFGGAFAAKIFIIHKLMKEFPNIGLADIDGEVKTTIEALCEDVRAACYHGVVMPYGFKAVVALELSRRDEAFYHAGGLLNEMKTHDGPEPIHGLINLLIAIGRYAERFASENF